MERRARLLVLIRGLALALFATAPAWGRVLETRAAALARVFGSDARLEPHTVFLSPAGIDSVRALARAPFDRPRFTYWAATRSDTLIGRAFLDTYTVRTMPATLLVAVDSVGKLLAVEFLAFHEPEDYLPPRRWIDRLLGRDLDDRLRPGDDVDGITGATLSARTTAESVRRCLALERSIASGI